MGASVIYLERVYARRVDRKTSETSQDMRFLGRNLRSGPPENEAGVYSIFGRAPTELFVTIMST